MKTFIACVLVMLAVTAGAGMYDSTIPDGLITDGNKVRIADNTINYISGSAFISNLRQPTDVCIKLSFGTVKVLTCGYDNVGKLMVDDCETIGFAHAWKEEAEVVSIPDGSPHFWVDNWGNKTPLGMSSYIAKRTRRCLNCTVVEEEYNEVTPKWRRK